MQISKEYGAISFQSLLYRISKSLVSCLAGFRVVSNSIHPSVLDLEGVLLSYGLGGEYEAQCSISR